MNNHFGKGLMAGLKATHADSAVNVTKYCADYKPKNKLHITAPV